MSAFAVNMIVMLIAGMIVGAVFSKWAINRADEKYDMFDQKGKHFRRTIASMLMVSLPILSVFSFLLASVNPS